MTTPQQQILDKCKEVVAKCKELYGMDLSAVRVSFDLRGRAAGRAQAKRFGARGDECTVKFNRDMLTREAFDHVLNDTVPHEYAHIVCFMDPSKGRNHDYGWAKVCRELGGDGARTHKEKVVYGKGATYEYISSTGKEVRVGERHHAEVQRGGTVRYRASSGIGHLNKACTFKIVGVNGRSLEQAIVPAGSPKVAPVALPVLKTSPTISPTPTYTIGVPVATTPKVSAAFPAGTSKAAMARAIMLAGYNSKQPYETIITAIMAATGHDRHLARATYKANTARVGIPAV